MRKCSVAFALMILIAVECAPNAKGDVVYATYFRGTTVSRATGPGAAATTFATGLTSTFGIAMSSNGTLYVDNTASGVIDSISPTGVVKPFVTIPFTQAGDTLSGMTIDPSGNLYVSILPDSQLTADEIDKVSPSGDVSYYDSGVYAEAMACDSAGHVFVASEYGYLFELDVNHTSAYQIGTLPGATGIAVDAAGNVYGCSNAGYIEKFSATGNDLGRYGSATYPWGIAFDSTGQLLVASSGPAGGIYTVGTGGAANTPYGTGWNAPVYFVVVPEPASFGMTGFSICMILQRRGRKKRDCAKEARKRRTRCDAETGK